MRKDREVRYQTATVLVEELHEVVRSLGGLGNSCSGTRDLPFQPEEGHRHLPELAREEDEQEREQVDRRLPIQQGQANPAQRKERRADGPRPGEEDIAGEPQAEPTAEFAGGDREQAASEGHTSGGRGLLTDLGQKLIEQGKAIGEERGEARGLSVLQGLRTPRIAMQPSRRQRRPIVTPSQRGAG